MPVEGQKNRHSEVEELRQEANAWYTYRPTNCVVVALPINPVWQEGAGRSQAVNRTNVWDYGVQL